MSVQWVWQINNGPLIVSADQLTYRHSAPHFGSQSTSHSSLNIRFPIWCGISAAYAHTLSASAAPPSRTQSGSSRADNPFPAINVVPVALCGRQRRSAAGECGRLDGASLPGTVPIIISRQQQPCIRIVAAQLLRHGLQVVGAQCHADRLTGKAVHREAGGVAFGEPDNRVVWAVQGICPPAGMRMSPLALISCTLTTSPTALCYGNKRSPGWKVRPPTRSGWPYKVRVPPPASPWRSGRYCRSETEQWRPEPVPFW
ncbi:Uncharacterised protein [Serratia marcescens]|nr:Uncharacterised protein [Serratia marcescens]CAI2086278.1 Uncharacterised protein [Serratia marcescens]